MSPFEVLYGWKCRTPVTWDSPLDELLLELDLLKDLEQLVTKVQQNIKEVQELQKIKWIIKEKINIIKSMNMFT